MTTFIRMQLWCHTCKNPLLIYEYEKDQRIISEIRQKAAELHKSGEGYKYAAAHKRIIQVIIKRLKQLTRWTCLEKVCYFYTKGEGQKKMHRETLKHAASGPQLFKHVNWMTCQKEHIQ